METLSGEGRHDEWALDLDDVAALGPTSVDGPAWWRRDDEGPRADLFRRQ